MSPLAFLFLLTLTPQTQDFSFHPQIQPFHVTRQIRLQPRELAQQNTCYTIRSYIFERKDGNAPELVAETTCTPSSQVGPQRVRPMPKPRLVPLSMTGEPKD